MRRPGTKSHVLCLLPARAHFYSVVSCFTLPFHSSALLEATVLWSRVDPVVTTWNAVSAVVTDAVSDILLLIPPLLLLLFYWRNVPTGMKLVSQLQ